MHANHTPGPWYADKLQDRNAYNIFAPGHCTALVTLEPGEYNGASPLCKNVHADAALIAAAPELLAALQSLLAMPVKGHALADRLQFSDSGRAILDQARAAIAKATGADHA